MAHTSTKKKAKAVSAALASDPDSLVRFADLLKLQSLARSTQEEYMRYVRKLAARKQCDPAELDEAQVREHLLYLKDKCGLAPSTIRTAAAAFTAFYRQHLGRDWRLFDLVSAPSPLKLPEVLTREEVARLFAAVREPRFRMALRLIYACGLRLSEALNLEVGDIKRDGPRLHLHHTKGLKERFVPLPLWCYRELQDYWRTHRHPRWIFPGVGRGWRDTESSVKLAQADEPMGVGSIQHCVQLARTEARLPATTHVHTLRHCALRAPFRFASGPTLDANRGLAISALTRSVVCHPPARGGVSIRLISAYLGHTSLETTLIYTHLTAVNEANARAALDKLKPAS